MSGLLVVASLLVVLGLAAGLLVARRPAGGAAPARVEEPVPLVVTRRTAAWRWAGVVAGLVLAVAVVQSGGLGRGPMLAAPVFGLTVLAGVLGGELSVTAPRGAVRTASLETRRVRDYVPPRLGAAVGAATGALALLLAATTALGSADDLGRAGRSLVRQCSALATGSSGGGPAVEAHGPWPGSYYSEPLAVVVLAGLVAAGLALRRIAGRPRPAGSAPGDDRLRRRAAAAATAACGVLVTLPLLGVSLFAAGGLLAISCRPAAWTVAGWTLLALLPVWLGLLAWCTAGVLAPTVATPEDVPAAAGPRRRP